LITESPGDGGVEQQSLYRQDRAGLYEIATSTTPASSDDVVAASGLLARLRTVYSDRPDADAWRRAAAEMQARLAALPASGIALAGRPGGALPGEFTRLVYPLHPGQAWVVIDDDFTMSASVEGHETLDLPTGRTLAWRVRLESSLYGPEDEVVFYYGKEGYLGRQVTVVTDAIDEDFQPIGQLVLHEVELLQDVSIDRREPDPCSTGTTSVPGGKNGLSAES
jgi:hypothetical protein